jgi:hypothetical protein
MRRSGAELADRLPPRINAPENSIARLLAIADQSDTKSAQAVPV